MGMSRNILLHGIKPHFGENLSKMLFSLWSCIVHVLTFIFKTFSRFSGEDKLVVENSAADDVCESEEGERSVENVSTSKYEFFAGNNSLCAFIEQPQTMSFTVQEMFVSSKHDDKTCTFTKEDVVEDPVALENDYMGLSVEFSDVLASNDVVDGSDLMENVENCELIEDDEDVKQGKTERFDCEISQEQEILSLNEVEFDEEVEGEIVNVEEERVSEEREISDEVVSSVKYSDDFWSSIHKYDDFSSGNCESDSDCDEMLCDISPSEPLGPETPMCIGDKRVEYDELSPRSLDDDLIDQSCFGLAEVSNGNDQDDGKGQFIEIEPESNLTGLDEEHIPSDEFSDSEDEFDEESSTFEYSKGIDSSESCEAEDDRSEMDILLEQKELIRQMKREMRSLKISGLPTILEESESPRVEDDLRPLKIDEKVGHKDRMEEIQILYRRYLDKMRKLDILSQQTMYAIGLLQLKHQAQFASNKKATVPVIKSLLAQNLWSNKLRKHEAQEPVQKLIRDSQRDLELVYVGQLCLSWEILKWQHQKAEQLHTHDTEGFRQHNLVAGEFQKFQVVLQRFTEDEPFDHGPRVQHFVKSRCNLPTLLQVPLIRDDPRSEWRGKGEGGISIGNLKEVIGASMRAFWEFLRADKDECHALSLIGIHAHHVDLEQPSDAELLSEIRSNLQKKEKRLKDLIRSGNCIVKKFQKHQNHRLTHEMFIAQVELRLVSRVLNMPRLTTDQLLWCHKKMNKINIVGRKIYLEPSFLLFPC